jgi:hypothetical protein
MAALPLPTSTCFVTSILSAFHTAHYQGVLLERILLQQLPVLFWDFGLYVCPYVCTDVYKNVCIRMNEHVF